MSTGYIAALKRAEARPPAPEQGVAGERRVSDEDVLQGSPWGARGRLREAQIPAGDRDDTRLEQDLLAVQAVR
jgi:hypothetical protein